MGLLDFLGPAKWYIIAGFLAPPWIALILISIFLPVVSWIFTIPAMVILAGITFLAVTFLVIKRNSMEGCTLAEGKWDCSNRESRLK